MDARTDLTEAYTSYLGSVQAAVPEHDQQTVAEAFGRYMQAMQAAAEAPAGQAAAEAFAQYEQAVRTALQPDGRGAQATAALSGYADAVRDVLDRAGPAGLDADTLALLAQQLGAAAWMAHDGSRG